MTFSEHRLVVWDGTVGTVTLGYADLHSALPTSVIALRSPNPRYVDRWVVRGNRDIIAESFDMCGVVQLLAPRTDAIADALLGRGICGAGGQHPH